MAVCRDLFSLINIYEGQIQCSTFTKSDISYHNTKQSLHNMWSKIYSMKTSTEKTALIGRIQQCLNKLERTAEKNEKRKYLNYYSSVKKNKEMNVC